jgi:hypothetical protein
MVQQPAAEYNDSDRRADLALIADQATSLAAGDLVAGGAAIARDIPAVLGGAWRP